MAVPVHPIGDEALANTSYLVEVGGDEAVVIDPRREADEYLELAERLGVRIVASLETHLHADFVSGSRELGSEIIAPAGSELRVAHRAVSHEDRVTFGAVTFEVLHTPGHSPEHVAYVVNGEAVFTGGSLIAGGAARTDLTGAEQTLELARAQHHSLQALAGLGDDVALYPTHGAGSFCSTASGPTEAATIGAERRSNPLLAVRGQSEFVARLVDGYGSFPPYFLHLREVNRKPPLLAEQDTARPLSPVDVVAAVERGAWLIDARPLVEWEAEHPEGAISIALRPSFASWLGWVVPFGEPFVLVIDQSVLPEAVGLARRIGYDGVLGWLDGGIDAWREAGLPTRSLEALTPEEARTRHHHGVTLLDVRQRSEWERSRIQGAVHLELGDIIAGKRPAGEVVAVCAHGERAATAASILQRDGARVANLAGGFSAWREAGLPVER